MAYSSESQFIAVHGIDGTGKTTTVQTLTELMVNEGKPTINYDEYEKSELVPYRIIKNQVRENGTVGEQLAFFLASTLFHSARIRELVERGESVIKSRYVLDVAAHHSHLGHVNVEKIVSLFPFFSPNLQVILVLDELERQNRILSRSDSTDQDLVKKELGSRPWFFENYLLANAGAIHPLSQITIIDTTSLSPEKVAKKIITDLKVLYG